MISKLEVAARELRATLGGRGAEVGYGVEVGLWGEVGPWGEVGLASSVSFGIVSQNFACNSIG